jgi:hypothetical protein
MWGKEFSINEIVIGISIIIVSFYISQYFNITIFQLLLIVLGIITVIYISMDKQKQTESKQKVTNLSETNNKALLDFVNSVSYFKLYNPPVYSDFMYKLKQYINILKFADLHDKNEYKLYPKKIIKENIESQKKDILETFASFEHSLDDRITSAYKLRDLTAQLNNILTKSNLIT